MSVFCFSPEDKTEVAPMLARKIFAQGEGTGDL